MIPFFFILSLLAILVILQLIGNGVVVAFPEVALWLPETMLD